MNGSGRELLHALKATSSNGGPLLGIPVGKQISAWLRPIVTAPGKTPSADLHALTHWRNRYVTSFLHEFEATEKRTAAWLAEVVGPDDTKILFMLDDAAGRTFGYMGLAAIDWGHGSVEADAIVRGLDAPRGVMSEALRTLISWARLQLDLPCVRVRVRSDNTALEFYKKLHFSEFMRKPLRRTEGSDGVKWIEDATVKDSQVDLVMMEHRCP